MAKQKQKTATADKTDVLDEIVAADRAVHGAPSAEGTNPWREHARLSRLREAAYMGDRAAYDEIADHLGHDDRQMIESQLEAPAQSARIAALRRGYASGESTLGPPGAASRIVEGGFQAALNAVEQAAAYSASLAYSAPIYGATEHEAPAAAEHTADLVRWAEEHEMALDALAVEGTTRTVDDVFSVPWAEKRLRGAVRSFSQVVLAGHPAVAIALFSGSEAANAAVEADRMGLTGAERSKYIAGQASIEATPATIMSVLGLHGGEKIASYPLRRLLLEVAGELGEEITTEIGHTLFRRYTMDELHEMTAAELGRVALDTATETILAAGAMSGPTSAAQHIQARRQMSRLVRGAEAEQEAAGMWLMDNGYLDRKTGEPTASGSRLFSKEVRKRDAAMAAGVEREGEAMRSALARYQAGGEITGRMADRLLRHGWVSEAGEVTEMGASQLEHAGEPAPAAATPETEEEITAALLGLGYRQTDIDAMLDRAPAEAEEIIARQWPRWSPAEDAEMYRQVADVAGADQTMTVVGLWHDGRPVAVDDDGGTAYTLAAVADEDQADGRVIATPLQDWHADSAAIARAARRARREGRVRRGPPQEAPADTAPEAAPEVAQKPAPEAAPEATALRIIPTEAEDASAVVAAAERLGLRAQQIDGGIDVVPTDEAGPGAMAALRDEVSAIADVEAPTPQAAPTDTAPAPVAQAAQAEPTTEVTTPTEPTPTEPSVTIEEVTAAGARAAARQASDPDARRVRRIGENPLDGPDVLTAIAVAGGITSKPKGYRGGEYDGMPRLTGNLTSTMNPRGGLMPDQMAQILHDRGLIQDATPNAMWEAVEQAAQARSTAKERAKELLEGPPPPEDVEPGPDEDTRAYPLTEAELDAAENAWGEPPFALGDMSERTKQGATIALARIVRMVGDNGLVRREADGSIAMVAKSGEVIRWSARPAPQHRPQARGALAATMRDEHGVLTGQVEIYPAAVEGTYGHELVHALRRLGLITEAEYQALVHQARKEGIDGLLGPYRDAYQERGYDDEQMAEALDEEMAAIYVDHYSVDKPMVQPRWWQRLQRWFLEAGAAAGLYPTPDMAGWQAAETVLSGAPFTRERPAGALEPDLEGMRWSLPTDGEPAPRQLDLFVDHMQTHLFDDQMMEERDAALEQVAPAKDARVHQLLVAGQTVEMDPSDSVSALAQDYYENRTPAFDVRGKTVTTANDAAVLFAMLRSPFVERISWIVNDAQGNVTASGIHTIGTVTGAEMALDPVNAREIYAAAAAAGPGATIWLSHNHPAGNPEPSAADRGAYGRARERIESRGYNAAFIIADGDSYSAMLPGEGELTVRPFDEPQRAAYEYVPFGAVGLKVQSPDTVAHISSLIQRDPSAVLGITLDIRSMVRGVDTWTDATPDEISDMVAKHMGSQAIIVTRSKDVADRMYMERGKIVGLRDVILIDDENGSRTSYRSIEKGVWDVGEATTVREGWGGYNAIAPDWTPLRYTAEQVDEVGARLEDADDFTRAGLAGEIGEDIRYELPEDQSEEVAKRHPNDDPPLIEQWAKKHRIAHLGAKGQKLAFAWVGRDQEHRVTIRKHLVPASIVRNLQAYNGTPFAAAALKSLEARADIHARIDPQSAETSATTRMPEWLSSALARARRGAGTRQPTVKAAAHQMLFGMIGTQGGVLSNPSKPELAVPGSYINCTPTKECAWKCFATNNLRQTAAAAVYRSEAMDIMAKKIPTELGTQIAREFKATELYAHGYALRFYDRGEGHAHWLRVIAAINGAGVRVHVFSKDPAFVSKIPKKNVAMFSVDRDNWEIGKRSGLPLAFVWQDLADAEALRSVRDQVQCLLPVMRSGKTVGSDIDVAREILGSRKVVCPVDAGDRTLGAAWRHDPASQTHTCARCDAEGIGCYWRQTTAKTWRTPVTINDQVNDIARIAQEEGVGNAQALAIARRNAAEIGGWGNQAATGIDPGADQTDVSGPSRARDRRRRRSKEDGHNRRDDPDVEAWSLPLENTHSANPRYFVTRSEQLIEDGSLPANAPGSQIYAYLRNKGVSENELFWLGLDDLQRDARPWSRDAIMALVSHTAPVYGTRMLDGPEDPTDPGPTTPRYPGYMPGLYEHVDDYHEILVTLDRSRPDVRQQVPVPGGHWSDVVSAPVVVHLRAGVGQTADASPVYYLGEIQSDYDAITAERNPLQRTWVQHGLLRGLREAVIGGNQYYAWSRGPEIAAATGGNPEAMEALYGTRVKRTAQKILRRIAPGQELTQVSIGLTDPNSGAPILHDAIEITPAVRDAALAGDMPLAYSLPERDVLQRRAPAQGMQRNIAKRLTEAADRATALEADDAFFALPSSREALDGLSSDPSANERMIAALSARPKEPGIMERLKELLAHQWALFRNTWVRLDEAKFPLAIEELKLLQSRMESSVIRAWRIQHAWSGQLSAEQQVDFSLLVALPDLVRTLEDDVEGLYADKPGAIPFYGRGDDETRTVAQIRKHVVADYQAAVQRSDPQVRRAIDQRTEWHRNFTAELVNYGLLSRDVMEDERYYHRIVIKHMDARRISGGKAGIRQRRVSAQRQRTGGGDFSLDYVLAETQYIAEMLAQEAKVDAWARLEAQHGIRDALKAQADAANDAAMNQAHRAEIEAEIEKAIAEGADREYVEGLRRTAERGWDAPYRQKMAINFQYLLKLVATGDLRGTPFADFEDAVEQAYRDWHDAMADMKDVREPGPPAGPQRPREESPRQPRLEVDHPSFWPFIHYIASGRHGPIVETTTLSGKPMMETRDVNPQLNALSVFKAMAERQRQAKRTLGPRFETWKGLAHEAEGYSIIQPEKGMLFAPGFTIQESALTALLEQSGQAVEEDVLSMLPDVVPVESRHIRRGRILIGPKPEFVWPTELVDTIEDLDQYYRGAQNLELHLEQFSRAWKKAILFGPWRWAKYETRNAFSDVDVALTYPGIMLQVPGAARDMASWASRSRGQAATGGAMFGALLGTGVGFAFGGPIGAAAGLTGGAVGLGSLMSMLYGAGQGSQIEMERWEDYQIYNSGQLLNEVGHLDAERSRELIGGRKPSLIGRYFGVTKHFNLWREGVLRLAAARYMLRRLRTDTNGRIEVRTYASSRRDAMDGLYDQQAALADGGERDQAQQMVYQIAAKLSRELLGDYGSISERGRHLRRTLAPFWSWQEINLPRYVRLLKNAPYEGQHRTGVHARQARTVVAIAGRNVLRLGVGGLAMTVMIRAWNAMMRAALDVDDAEDPNQRGRGHFIIIGRDMDGEIRAISIAGAMQDAAGWIGVDDWAAHQRTIERADFRGETWKGVKEVAGDMAFAPVQRAADLITPWIKVPAEQAAGQQYFPDLRRPRAIKDRWEHLFSAAGVKDAYMAWSRRASPEEVLDTMTYSFHPGASAYWQAKGLAWDFQERIGKKSSGVFLPKEHTWCLSQAKSAWQMDDAGRADYWLMRYFQAGGDLKKYASSRRAGHPLAPVAKIRRQRFWDELDERDRSYVRLGIAWWEEQGAGSPAFNQRVRDVYNKYRKSQ